MQKSFLLSLGAFVVVASLFIFGGEHVEVNEVVTTFEVSDSGITVNNELTGESFVIENDMITETPAALSNIAPAAGDDISSDIDTILSIEDDVIKEIK